MLIKSLLKSRQLKVAALAAQGQQQQKLLLAETWLLTQRAKAFIGSTPGLIVSFGIGCVFQLRHHYAMKLVRSAIGLRWLRTLRAWVK